MQMFYIKYEQIAASKMDPNHFLMLLLLRFELFDVFNGSTSGKDQARRKTSITYFLCIFLSLCLSLGLSLSFSLFLSISLVFTLWLSVIQAVLNHLNLCGSCRSC